MTKCLLLYYFSLELFFFIFLKKINKKKLQKALIKYLNDFFFSNFKLTLNIQHKLPYNCLYLK